MEVSKTMIDDGTKWIFGRTGIPLRMLSEFHKEIIHLKTLAKFPKKLTFFTPLYAHVSSSENFANVFKWMISLWNSDSILDFANFCKRTK